MIADKFEIQQKTWIGWKTIGRTVSGDAGSIWRPYSSKFIRVLLDEVLEKHFNLRNIRIIEYPMIKIY